MRHSKSEDQAAGDKEWLLMLTVDGLGDWGAGAKKQ
jgi:hypothetical protein